MMFSLNKYNIHTEICVVSVQHQFYIIEQSTRQFNIYIVKFFILITQTIELLFDILA